MHSGKGSATGRFIAIFVALAFAFIAVLQLAFYFSQPGRFNGPIVPWVGILLVSGFLLGAVFLSWGAVLWFGNFAMLLRWLGFLLLFLFSIIDFSFSFFLIPIILLTIFSLSRHEQGEAVHRSIIVPIVISLFGIILLFLSMTLNWYDWVYQSNNVIVGIWQVDKNLAIFIVITIFLTLLSLTLQFLIKKQLINYIAMVATLSTAVFIGIRVVRPASGADVISVGLGPGILLGLVGASLLVMGTILRIISSSDLSMPQNNSHVCPEMRPGRSCSN